MNDALQKHCDSVIGQMFERCHENAPNFGVTSDCFARCLSATLAKRRVIQSARVVSARELDAVIARDWFTQRRQEKRLEAEVRLAQTS